MDSEELPLSEEEKKLTELVRATVAGGVEFKPFVMYNPDLRRITVCVRDCSCTEHSHHGLYILEDNYPLEGEYPFVGFEIESPLYLVPAVRLESRPN